jgi:hypothetical protein
MGVLTRDLFSMAQSRTADTQVWIQSEVSDQLLDGSFNVTSTLVPYMARMADLQPDQIQRLQQGGITIHAGASVAIPYEFEAAPDSLIYSGKTYKIVESTISENCSVLVIDKAPIGFSNVEAQA